MTQNRLSRRKLLAGLGGAGTASIGGLVLTTERSQPFTETLEIQTRGINGLLLEWRETYNGATLTNAADGVSRPATDGPAISLGNVLPGDTGTLSVRIRLEDEAADEVAVKPVLTVTLTSEQGSPGLEDFLDSTVWYDTGLLGIDAFGARNARRDFGEGLVHPDAAGTLADVATALEDGVVLDPAPSLPGTSCLEVGDAVTVTFGWTFPPNQEGINAVQGKSVEFDLQFDAERC